MYSSVTPPTPFETVPVSTLHVSCDGGEGALGHPKVYLDINPDIGRIACPYCSREFIFEARA